MPSTKAGGAASPAMTLYFDDVPLRNQLLAALDVAALDGIKPHFSTVHIAPPIALFGVDGSIGDVYFPETAIVSVVNTVHCRSVEVEAVGNDGMAGLHVFLNDTDSTARAFALGSGVVRRMDARVFKRLSAVPGPLHEIMLRYTRAVLARATQTTTCLSTHLLQQRFAGWLLLTRERVGENEFPLTQAFLSLILGVRRDGVTLAMRSFEDRQLIRCTRDYVEIVDLEGLEREACSCHAIGRETFARLLPLTARAS